MYTYIYIYIYTYIYIYIYEYTFMYVDIYTNIDSCLHKPYCCIIFAWHWKRGASSGISPFFHFSYRQEAEARGTKRSATGETLAKAERGHCMAPKDYIFVRILLTMVYDIRYNLLWCILQSIWYLNIRIQQTMISGIPLILVLGTRM